MSELSSDSSEVVAEGIYIHLYATATITKANLISFEEEYLVLSRFIFFNLEIFKIALYVQIVLI